jgi:cysteine desulfuration protein SufE
MTIKEIQNEIIDELSMFDADIDKMQYLIDLGRTLPLIKEEFKTETYLVKGCQSDLWLHSELKEDKIVFTADAAAIIPKGIIAILIRVFSNQKPKDILENDINAFLKEANLNDFFQMTRSNGLEKMIKQIKLDALGFSLKNK